MIKKRPHNFKWSFSACKKEALKYKTRSTFGKRSRGAYKAALKDGFLNEICSHMIEIKKPNGYWNYNSCKQEAKKYKHKTEFLKKSSGAYDKARKKGWLDDICSHMIPPEKYLEKKNSKFYVYVYLFSDKHFYVGLTKDINKRKYTHLTKDESAVYNHIKICSIFNFKIKNNFAIKKIEAQELEHKTKLNYIKAGYKCLNKGKTGKNIGATGSGIIWTFEKCKKEAKKYNQRSHFMKNSMGAYTRARKEGWLNEICSHMIEYKKPNGYWTFERCKKEVKKYKTKKDFYKKSNGAYDRARKEGWLDEFFPKK